MAGFDFRVSKQRSAAGEQLQRSLFRWIQANARDLALKFRYYSEGRDLWGVLDGPLVSMHLLRAYLDEDFYAYASAYAIPPDRRQRLAVAKRLLDAFDEGLAEITQGVQEIAGTFGGTPNSIVFHYGKKTHLARPLRSLTQTLIGEMQGRVSTATVVEETHTVIEVLLRNALGRDARRLSFHDMVDAAYERDLIVGNQADDVKKLSRVRRNAKHRGQGFDEMEAQRLLVEATTVIHKLLASLQT